MKKIENTVAGKTKMHRFTSKRIMSFSFILLVILVAAECKKQGAAIPENKVQCGTTALNDNDNLTAQFKGLNLKTAQQLLEARTASVKYQDINKAFKDGYEDINVVLPNMGYHFMKLRFVDSVFDPKKPELLVYNKRADGSFELGAVEYAVPISLTPNAPPQGFGGSADVWDYNTAFGLWTLHAWVWKFNPDGVFSPMNSRVHVR
jgi:hypothetical protein